MIIPKNPNELYSEKIRDISQIKIGVDNAKRDGKKVGFCVGGFDLLHYGHMAHLKSAKNLCDFLVVGITKDEFLKKAKGENRPIYTSQIRAYSISQLSCVDLIFVREHSSAVESIYLLKPDFYIKGPECKDNPFAPNIIDEKKAIEKIGGKMKYTSDEIFSTTELIRYIKNV